MIKELIISAFFEQNLSNQVKIYLTVWDPFFLKKILEIQACLLWLNFDSSPLLSMLPFITRRLAKP